MNRTPLFDLLIAGLANSYDVGELPSTVDLLGADALAPPPLPAHIRPSPVVRLAWQVVNAPEASQLQALLRLTARRVLSSSSYWTPFLDNLTVRPNDPFAQRRAAGQGVHRILRFLHRSIDDRGALDHVPLAWREDVREAIAGFEYWLSVDDESERPITRTKTLVNKTGRVLTRAFVAALGLHPATPLYVLQRETPTLLRTVVPSERAHYHTRTRHNLFDPRRRMGFVAVESALVSLRVVEGEGQVTRLLDLSGTEGDIHAHHREIFRLYLLQMLAEMYPGRITTRVTFRDVGIPSFAAWSKYGADHAGSVIPRGPTGDPLLCFQEQHGNAAWLAETPDFVEAMPLYTWLQAS